MSTLAPGIPGANIPTPSLPPPGAVNNIVPFRPPARPVLPPPLPNTPPLPNLPRRPPPTSPPVGAPAPLPFSSLQGLDPIEYGQLLMELGDLPGDVPMPTLSKPPFTGGQVRGVGYRGFVVHQSVFRDDSLGTPGTASTDPLAGPIVALSTNITRTGASVTIRNANGFTASGGNAGSGNSVRRIQLDSGVRRVDGTPPDQDQAQGGSPPGIPTPIGPPFSAAPPTEAPPNAPPLIPDTIPEILPPGIPDPNDPTDPEIPDFIPEKLPDGIPDPEYPDPVPGPDEDEDDPSQPDTPPEEDAPEEEPKDPVPLPGPKLPELDPGVPGPEIPGDLPGIPLIPETPPEEEKPEITEPDLPDKIPDEVPEDVPEKLPDQIPGDIPGEQPVDIPGDDPVDKPGEGDDKVPIPDGVPGGGNDNDDDKDDDKVPIPDGVPGGGNDNDDKDDDKIPIPDGTPGGGKDPGINPIGNDIVGPIPGSGIGVPGPDWPGPNEDFDVPPPKCPPGCIPEDGQCDDMKIDICNEPCIQTLLKRTSQIQDDVQAIKRDVNDVQSDVGEIKEGVEVIQTDLLLMGIALDVIESNTEEVKEELTTEQSLTIPFTDCDEGPPRQTPIAAKPLQVLVQALQVLATDEDSRGQRLCDLQNIERIYKILGGSSWFAAAEQETPSLSLNPEDAIEQRRSQAFDDDTPKEITVNNLIALMQSLAAVDRHRSGHHELPASVPEDLTNDSSPMKELHTHMQWEEWAVRQLDGLMGAWPLKIKYRDANNKTVELEFKNLAELQAELMGLVLGIASDTDILQELAFKGIAETIKAESSAIQAADYAKANAEFLGYKSNEQGKDLPLSITPGAKSIKDALKPSKQKITRVRFDDQTDLREYLQRILVAGEIIKAAFYRPYSPGDNLPGDNLKDIRDQDETEQDTSWNDYLNELRNLEGQRFSPITPKPDIKNLANEENDQS